ncbi:MAG: DUF1361 domain-containing protein [Bacteroidota bacterium]|nr:DUF1361 domain-containing protein [Bacteroidota bacterium]
MTYLSGSKDYSSFPLTFHQWLIASCTFSYMLLCSRVIVTGHITYVFLLWNLFLAFVPYAISWGLSSNPPVIKNKWILVFSLCSWLLFIPNAFYIVTDFFHLRDIHSAPNWFDLLLLLSFAWNGLVFGIASLRKIETILYAISGRTFSVFTIFAVMWMNAYGMYLGRFLRYNSWDIITRPFSLFDEIASMLLHPFDNKMEWGMILCYAVFMTLFYITIKKLAENFSHHNK